MWIDNVRLVDSGLNQAQQKELDRLAREWEYCAKQAKKLRPRSERAAAIHKDALRQWADAIGGRPGLFEEKDENLKKIAAYSAELRQIKFPEEKVIVSFAYPYTPLKPWEFPVSRRIEKWEVTSLQGEWQALGIVLANCQNKDVDCLVKVDGLDLKNFKVSIRRQAFLETWYKKQKTRVADPLPLLKRRESSWMLKIPAGNTEKLYIEIFVGGNANGELDASVKVDANGEEMILPFHVNVIPRDSQSLEKVEQMAFIYPTDNVAGHSPTLTAKDLRDHGVTMMEFPFLPKTTFNSDGDIEKIDFGKHEIWMKTYGPYIKMAIFWNPVTLGELKCADGTILEPYSPAWFNAYGNLLKAFLAHGRKLGLDSSRFIIWPGDEIHSKTFAESPDKGIGNFIELCKVAKKVAPGIPILVTLGNYAYPKDVAAVAEYIDCWISHWPLPERLHSKFAPPSYNPRVDFFAQKLPFLKKLQRENGCELLTYHVGRGKSDNVMRHCRAYPIIVAGMGLKGIGTWSYNTNCGSSWDDTEAPLLDYGLVYDGKENHPTNRELNPTGEIIVPSLRWEALRMGIQDARVYWTLKKTHDDSLNISAEKREKLGELIKHVASFAKKHERRVGPPVSHKMMFEQAREMRLLSLNQ
jgi:hypothetical protein